MDNSHNFETYFFVSKKKIQINVYDKKNSKSIFYDEKNNDNFHSELNLELIDFFLEKNIFKIEKSIDSFIKNINLIVKSDEFLQVDISIKKNNNGDIFEKNDLVHLLNEAKQDCKNTINDKKIIHMTIDKYLIDEKEFSSFPNNLRCNYISIDIRFVCLPLNYLNKIEDIFKNYQIAIKHILNFNYVESYLDQKTDFFVMASKIIDGYNKNEVIIVPKKTNIKGFFERFFNYFS